MDDSYRHLYLYAKGHYERTTIMEDLKVIIGKRSMILPEHVSEENVLLVTSNAVGTNLNFIKFIHILSDIRRYYKINDFTTLILLTILSHMRFMDIADLNFDLGIADAKILPLQKKTFTGI